MIYFYASVFFIFGLLIGSFLNVVILRLPLGKDIVYKRSACPQCDYQLQWFHNIPVFSFVFLRGKCSNCGVRISWQYPLVEIIAGFISLWLMPTEFNVFTVTNYIFYFSIACVFIAHILIDLKHMLLLDSLNLYLLMIILAHSIVSYHWSFYVVGGAIGFFIPLLVTWIFYKLRGQIGLGGGDIKLYGILGLLLGPLGIFFNIFMSCFVGAIIGSMVIYFNKLKKETPLPFGPSIIFVAAIQIFFPEFSRQVINFFI